MIYLIYAIFGMLTFSMVRWKLFRTKKNQDLVLPKGPGAWPLLGNFVQMVKNPHLQLTQWAKTHGELYTIFLANKPALVVTNPNMIKELFSQTASIGKFKTDTMLLISRGPYGILNTEGMAWIEQKQFCIRTLIKFGFGSGTLESLMLEEVKEVFQWIDKQKQVHGDHIILNRILRQAVNNALWTTISGERICLEDDRITSLLENFLDAMQYTVETGLAFFPWLKHLSPSLSGYTGFDKACINLHNYVRSLFEEHRNDYVEGRLKDVIECYLEEIAKTTDKRSSFYKEKGLINAVSTIVELLAGGSDTTSATIIWMAIYLSWNPEMQQKLFEEIDKVVGQDRDPSFPDRTNMPYTEAVILETLRCSTLLPQGIIHQLSENLNFHGYRLPKGLLLIPNIYGCHYSTEAWQDPQLFRPERFIDNPELKEILIPFQPGKRSCPGEPLAKDVLFLFASKIFQKWKVEPSPGHSKDEYFKPNVGVLMLPKHLPLKITKR